jgi:xylitol oxidase
VKNWAGNITYSTERVLRPRWVAEAREMVAGAHTLRPLGTRHSFNVIADSTGVLLSTEHLNRIVEIGDGTVTVEAGIRYGELSSALRDHGLALPNLASLPHISVGGAIATGTHGSGAGNHSLAAGISALELVTADGSAQRLRRGDADFDGAVVSLGALGLVTHASLDVLPAFELRQYVFEELPWSSAETDLEAILAGGYSVSVFTTWADPAIGQVWVKTKEQLSSQSSYFGAIPAQEPRHPVPGADWRSSTEQLGAPGPSYERLPHFRLGFTPSRGAELQSEYVVPREHGADALGELRRLGGVVAPLLLVSEIRAVAADTLWLSPFYEQDSIAFHFTWKPRPDDVLTVLPQIEAALAPFGVRPHWGKLFTASAQELEAVYPKLPDFRRLVRRFDSGGEFGNDFLARYVMSTSPARRTVPRRGTGIGATSCCGGAASERTIPGVAIQQLVSAETGWRAVFAEPDGSESLSRVVAWAAQGDAIVGLIVDPAAPAQIVPAAEASSPSGGKFNRYRYVPEKPAPAAASAKAGEEGKAPDPEDAAKQLVKSVIKRRR